MMTTPALSSRIYGRRLLARILKISSATRPPTWHLCSPKISLRPVARTVSAACSALWCCTLREFCRLALPECLSSPAVRVPLISASLFIAMTLAMLPGAAAPVRSDFDYLRIVLLLPLFSTPAIALIALWACRQRRVLSVAPTGGCYE